MNKIGIAIAATIIAVLLCGATLSPRASAQQQCRVKKVGTTAEDLSAGVTPDLWGVIIGVSNYKYGGVQVGGYLIQNLQYAADDADAMYDFLRSDRGGGFREDRIILLKDEEATKEKVEGALNWLKRARPNDYFIIFIAAHGAIDWKANSESNSKIPYFILYDTDPRDLENTAIRMTSFQQVVENDLPAKGLVLSDTCHSAGVLLLGSNGTISVNATDNDIQDIKKLNKAVGYISASYQTEASIEKAELYHGVFTYCLLQALRGEADADHNDIVTFDEVVKYLFEEVPKETGGQQHISPATNSIDANCLPLAVGYSGAEGSEHGTLVIRNPDLDEVRFRVDDGPYEKLRRGVETTLRLPAGLHDISFVKEGTRNGNLRAKIERGDMAEVNLQLSFSQNDEPGPTGQTVRRFAVHLIEERGPSEKAEKLFLEGVENFDKQRFDKAAAKLADAAQTEDGNYHQALVYRGRAEQSLGQQEKAIAAFRKAHELRPSDYQTETLLEEAKFDLAKTQPNARAEVLRISKNLKAIIRRYPRYDFARVVFGDVLYWLGDRNGAERELRHAIRGNSPPAHMILADVLTYNPTKAKREEAVREAETALELFNEIATKKVTFKRLSLSHLIFGGGRYVNKAAMAEAHYILGRALISAIEYAPAHPNRDAYLERARASLMEARELARGISNKLRLALVLATSAQGNLLRGDAESVIKDAEESLSLSGATSNPRLRGYLHNLLSQAFENKQDYCKAAGHHKEFIRIYYDPNTGEEMTKAKERLRFLISEAEARRQKCNP